MITWIKKVWFKFEAWVAKWAPGLKTKIVAVLGMVGSSAATLQAYLGGIPDNKFITGTQLGIVAFVLFTLAFWFKDLGARVEARVSSS